MTNRCVICESEKWAAAEEWRGFRLATCRVCGVKSTTRSDDFVARMLKGLSMVGLYRNWPLVFADRLRLLHKEPIIYNLRTGNKFLAVAGTHDVQVINEIWIDRIYTPWTDAIPADWVDRRLFRPSLRQQT